MEEVKSMSYDFGGYATKNDIRCSDGRIIRSGAFDDCDGSRVPLVWQHIHDDVSNVLGHADLEVRSDGVYARCSLNHTVNGENAREMVKSGDLSSLSIYANQLKQMGSDVVHGMIREVSLVLSGANPGAKIDNLTMAHSDGSFDVLDDEAVIYPNQGLELIHSGDSDSETEDEEETVQDVFDTLNEKQRKAVYAIIGQLVSDGTVAHADDDENSTEAVPASTPKSGISGEGKTIGEVFDTLSEEQKNAVYALIGQSLEDAGIDPESLNKGGSADDAEIAQSGLYYDKGDYIMHNNVFSGNGDDGNYLTHADMKAVIDEAHEIGSLRTAAKNHGLENVTAIEGNSLAHGITSIDTLFPEVSNVSGTPALITRPISVA